MSHAQHVVIALIWRQGHLLVGLRPEKKACALLWEFPGGKCEPGETHRQALVRECEEELAVHIVVDGPVAQARSVSPEGPLQLHFYHAHLKDAAQVPQALCTKALRWVLPEALLALPFCPGDLALVAELAAGTITQPGQIAA